MTNNESTNQPTKKPVVHKASTFEEAEKWDIEQHVRMTPDERRRVAYQLKKRVFGDKWIDIRESWRNR